MNRGRLYSPDGLGGTGGGTEPGEQPKNSGDSKPMNRAQMMLAKKNDNGGSKIRNFEQKLSGSHHESAWSRTPNVTGTGAIHVKSFHCKLTDESLHYVDQQINEWLDKHPEYEVKFVSSSVGTFTGKSKEPNLILQVWV